LIVVTRIYIRDGNFEKQIRSKSKPDSHPVHLRKTPIQHAKTLRGMPKIAYLNPKI